MNHKNRFLQSLIALAALTPAAPAMAGNAGAESAPTAAVASPDKITFASNLPTKLDDARPDAAKPNDGVWVRFDFTQIVQQVAPGPLTAQISPMEAFKLASTQA